MSATVTMTPSVLELAGELHAAMVAARDSLSRAYTLAGELSDAATGNTGPRDERVVRLAHALGDDAKSWAGTWMDDSDLFNHLGGAIDEARDIVDLAVLACSPREEVAS